MLVNCVSPDFFRKKKTSERRFIYLRRRWVSLNANEIQSLKPGPHVLLLDSYNNFVYKLQKTHKTLTQLVIRRKALYLSINVKEALANI